MNDNLDKDITLLIRFTSDSTIILKIKLILNNTELQYNKINKTSKLSVTLE